MSSNITPSTPRMTRKQYQSPKKKKKIERFFDISKALAQIAFFIRIIIAAISQLIDWLTSVLK